MTIFITNLAVLLIAIGLLILFVLVPFYGEMFKTEDAYQQQMASRYFVVLMERCIWVFFAMLIPLFVQQSLVIHKICGPIVRFKHKLNSLSRRDLTDEIHLRKHDFFHKEAKQINEIQEMFSGILITLTNQQKDIIKELNTFSSPDKTGELLENIERKVQTSLDVLSQVKV